MEEHALPPLTCLFEVRRLSAVVWAGHHPKVHERTATTEEKIRKIDCHAWDNHSHVNIGRSSSGRVGALPRM